MLVRVLVLVDMVSDLQGVQLTDGYSRVGRAWKKSK